MAQVPDGVTDKDQLYVVAREVLLDGLEALESQAEAVTIVGAQAIYLRSADVDLTVPIFTSDADLSIDPAYLTNPPLIEDALSDAGFVRREQPGQWYTSRRVGDVVADIAVDLLVPQAVAGRRGRSADITPHERGAARQVDGLEAALLDADVMEVASLMPKHETETGRHRRHPLSARVAGPAALFVAKAYKIAQRRNEPGQRRLDNKDAGDVIRLMMATDPDDVTERFRALLNDQRTQDVTSKGLKDLHTLFGGAGTPGTLMAVEALAGDPIEEQIPGIAVAYLDLLPHGG